MFAAMNGMGFNVPAIQGGGSAGGSEMLTRIQAANWAQMLQAFQMFQQLTGQPVTQGEAASAQLMRMLQLAAQAPPADGLAASAPPNLAAERGGTAWGRALADDARRNANGPGGWCYKWVAQALARHGVRVSGASAYMGADQLARSPKFREVQGLRADQLKQLPPGAVVVWDKGPGRPHGHISIALGDGREASDKLRNQCTNFGTNFRVFFPNQ